MIRAITSEDLRDCARLFVKVFSEWPYEELGLRQHRYYKFYCGTVKTGVE